MGGIWWVFSAVRGADAHIYNFLSQFNGNWLIDHIAGESEMNGLLRGGLFFAAYWYFWFANPPDRSRDQRRRAIIVILIGSLLALALNRTISFLVPFRARPMVNPLLMHRPLSIPMTPNLEHWSAFPSDTATYYFALAFGLAWLSRRLAVPAMLYTTFWICLVRVYLGLHYASDIVVGAAIGVVVVWAALRTDWLQSVVAPRILARESKPELFYAAAFLLTFEMADVFDHIRDAVRGMLHAARVGPHHQLIFHAVIPACAGAGILAGATWLVIRLRRAHREAAPHPPLAAPPPGLT